MGNRPLQPLAGADPGAGRLTFWWVYVAFAMMGAAVAVLVVGTLLSRKTAASPPATTRPAVVLPSKPVEVTILQRKSSPVPGSEKTLIITLGDITGGQVLVTVSDDRGNEWLPMRSMKPGDAAEFAVAEGLCRVELVKIENFLTGDDFAVLRVTPLEPTTQASVGLTEEQKIEHLIGYVAQLGDAVFIRNGSEHTPAEAADHMRLKWKNAGGRITTAQQFIEHAASHSAMTGRLYLVRFNDGRETTARELLEGELKRIGR